MQVASFIRRQDLGPRVLTLALALCHDDENAHLRLTAAALLNSLADVMGPDITIQFLMPELIALSEDPHYDVRKMAVLSIEAIGRVIGPAVTATRLLPMFIRWSCDDIWIIRKACASSIIHLSKALDPVIRVQSLVPIFERLSSDTSKFVRAAAYDNFGLFVATLPGDKIPPSFLNHYKRMGIVTVDNNLKDLPKINAQSELRDVACLDSDLAAKAAYSFPAVLLALGRNRWNEVRPVFYSLVKDPQPSVRQPIAAALAEIAKIIGPEATVADVLPVLDIFLHDVDEVKQKVLRVLSAVIALLPPETREGYAPFVRSFFAAKNASAWRARQSLVPQLYAFSTLFSLYSFASYIAPIVFDLLEDPSLDIRLGTAAVLPDILNMLLFSADPPQASSNKQDPKTPDRSLLRNTLSGQKKTSANSAKDASNTKESGKSLSAFLSGVSQGTATTNSPLSNPPTQLQAIVKSEILENSVEFTPNAHFTTFYNQLVQLLVQSDCYRNRKTFVAVAEAVLQSVHCHLFVPYILPHLVTLLQDPVRDIRIAVAAMLAPYAPVFAILEHLFQQEWLHYLKAHPKELVYAPSAIEVLTKYGTTQKEASDASTTLVLTQWNKDSATALESFLNPFVRVLKPETKSKDSSNSDDTLRKNLESEMDATVTKDGTIPGDVSPNNASQKKGELDTTKEEQSPVSNIKISPPSESESTTPAVDKHLFLLPACYPPTMTPASLLRKLNFALQRQSVKQLLSSLSDPRCHANQANANANAPEPQTPSAPSPAAAQAWLPAWLQQYLERSFAVLAAHLHASSSPSASSTSASTSSSPAASPTASGAGSPTSPGSPTALNTLPLPNPIPVTAWDAPHPLGTLYTTLRTLVLEDDLQIVQNLEAHAQIWVERHRYTPDPCPSSYLRRRNLTASANCPPINYDYNALCMDGFIKATPEQHAKEEPSILLEIAEEEKVPINAPLPSLGGQTYASAAACNGSFPYGMLDSLRGAAGGVCPTAEAPQNTTGVNSSAVESAEEDGSADTPSPSTAAFPNLPKGDTSTAVIAATADADAKDIDEVQKSATDAVERVKNVDIASISPIKPPTKNAAAVPEVLFDEEDLTSVAMSESMCLEETLEGF